MTQTIERTTLSNLVFNEEYCRKVLPFIKPDYFQGVYRILFKEAGKFVGKYNKLPSAETFKIELDQSDMIGGEQYSVAVDILPQLFSKEKIDDTWLIDTTEKMVSRSCNL